MNTSANGPATVPPVAVTGMGMDPAALRPTADLADPRLMAALAALRPETTKLPFG